MARIASSFSKNIWGNYTSCLYNFTNRTLNITKLLIDKAGVSYYNAGM